MLIDDYEYYNTKYYIIIFIVFTPYGYPYHILFTLQL